MKIKKEDVKSIEFVLENCECIIVPIECFRTLNIVDDNMDIENECTLNKFECVITYKNGLDYSFGFQTKVTPLQRLASYKDICYININLKDGQEFKCYMSWFEEGEYSNSEDNDNQKTIMKSYKELYIKVEKNSKEYTIEEIFQFGIPDYGYREFIGDDGITYRLKCDEDKRYLFNTIITDKLLHTKFKSIN